ncbi:MAG TPA: nucleotidyl transferase AbiEii/AbiGii toxin family protein [Agitococcus sp.]|nr:nucleotidyl transferase AbiEii/AbiGii toxin family protein [Agitococcus sp.]HMV60472.1 nucleotidyl transferase AbiEii/AbiGii toxin family protein [Agitococcus sp.]HMY28669.1 nucleotidyl transferase AbiEii/AbiGii toxin family protein [Agitococcus sp.]HNA20912.1 nucleotidyl transferase AbiEii/AbiGii toxin family protein [Agitococcus sp.]HNC03082.1 nucleotidyl transferase AbiEii/AbiGii toxin family protein [Agitococcus sp.]
MNNQKVMIEMIDVVAQSLGDDLLEKVVFVGGCTTALLVDDVVTLQHIRSTEDVDMIVEVLSKSEYQDLCQKLRQRGFKESVEDDVICRWRLGSMIVDVMPTDQEILGFSNIWYPEAVEFAKSYQLPSNRIIRVVSPTYFLATKIEAFAGRGNNDFLASQDIEDILSLIDGCSSLIADLHAANKKVKSAIAAAIQTFLNESDFEYQVQSVAQDRQHENLLFERLIEISHL